MAILVQLNGNDSGEGFLVAPLGTRTFDAVIALQTDAGTASVTLQASPNAAGLVFSQTAVDIDTNPTFVSVHATAQSGSRNDTTIEVLEGAVVVQSIDITSIAHPVVHFRGRFQARFATQPAFYNLNPFYEAADETPGPGWTWGLEGEPSFVPASGNIPENLEMPVGRQIRFNNPVALRGPVLAPGEDPVANPGKVRPVVTAVDAVEGETLSGTERFTVGDPVIGQPVNVGPNTYFAGNRNVDLSQPLPEENWTDAEEPMGLFELHLGNLFSGASKIGPFTHKAPPPPGPLQGANEHTRVPDSRPIAFGLEDASAERTEFGLPSVQEISEARIAVLVTEFDALPPGDSPDRRNLRRRIGRLFFHVSPATRDAITAAHPGVFTTLTPATIEIGWTDKEVFVGDVDADLQFQPGDSSVITYFGQFTSFVFQDHMFSFHSDELCAYHKGSVTASLASGFPDFTGGVYDAETEVPASFAPVTATSMDEASITALLGGGPTSERTVLTLSPDLTRLIVSRVTIVDDTLAPASWQIATKTDSWVCELIPEVSTLYRDMIFLVLPPTHERNVLGDCEGTATAPPPTVGYARIWFDTNASTWRYALHAGVPGAAGSTQLGTYAGSSATKVPACTQPELDLLTPIVDFGKVETGMVLHRQILLLNRSAASINVQLPSILPPFGAPEATSVDIPAGAIGSLVVSYTAGPNGPQESSMIALSSTPAVTGSLDVTLYGDPESVAAVNAVLVLDRSFSMSEQAFLSGSGFVRSKAQLRNEAAQVFVDLLRPDDQIGMVRFNNTTAVHMPIETAGDGSAGTGKADAAAALLSTDLNPSGSTAIGSAMVEGDTMLTPPTPNKKAMIVLTDGKENIPPFIDAITLTAGAEVYAIGIGTPDEINVEKLDAITSHTGGYLLLTGDMGAADEYKLHKYYTQILAGIAGDQIVVDPRAVIGMGQVQRTPFYLGEADAHVDVVLLNNKQKLDFWLEAPDGSVINPTSAGLNAEFIQGKKCRFYRLRAPVFPADPTRGYGGWNAVVRYPGDLGFKLRSNVTFAKGGQRAFADLLDPEKQMEGFARLAQTHRAIAAPSKSQASNVQSYNVVVRARSSLRLDVRLVTDSMGPRAQREIVATVMAFGRPYLEPVQLIAELTGPDRTVAFVPLQPGGNGTYSAPIKPTGRMGSYQIVVRASGKAPGGVPLQREQSLSMPVIVPGSSDSPQPAPDSHDLDALKDAIKDLVNQVNELVTQPKPNTAEKLQKWLLWILIVLILLFLLLTYTVLRA